MPHAPHPHDAMSGPALRDPLRERRDEMLGAIEVGLWYCDLPFDVLEWDRKVKEHFWLPADARVTIETFYARIHPDDRERTRGAIAHAIAAGEPYDIEYRTVAPAGHPQAGEVRWVRAIGYTAYDDEGAPVRFDGVTVDVTSQKRVAEALAASEQRYEYAARATFNAIWDWDLVGGTLAWNDGVHAVFGYAPGSVPGTIAWWYEAIHPDDRDRVVAAVHAVIDGDEAGQSWTGEYRFRRADGAYAIVMDRGYVARDATGRAVRMIGAMEDVTSVRAAAARTEAARLAAEEAARRTERLQELTAALAGAGSEAEVAALVMRHAVLPTGAYAGALVERTPDGAEVEIRASVGYPEAACMGPGRRWPIDATLPVVEAIRTGAPVLVESPEAWVARWPGGYAPPPASASRAWVAFPIDTSDGPPAALLWTFAEPRAPGEAERGFMAAAAQQGAQALERARLRERERRARAEAEIANQAKSEFLARMSHDLRTPLNAIGGYAQLIEMEVHGPVTGAQREALGRVSRAQQHLLTLINDILSFARLEAGQVQVVPDTVPVAPLLEELGALALPDANARGLVLEVLPVDPLLTVRADRERLLQVLLNLAGNAVKFTDAGRVEVSAEADGERVRLRVRDTGIGIAPDRIATIFQPFVQGHGTVADRRAGVGLGLTISHELTRIMGGTLEVDSAPAAGSTFTVVLPRSEGAHAAA